MKTPRIALLVLAIALAFILAACQQAASGPGPAPGEVPIGQGDEFGRDVDLPRLPGELQSAYAERLIERMQKIVKEADLRIIDLENMMAIASTYGPADDE